MAENFTVTVETCEELSRAEARRRALMSVGADPVVVDRALKGADDERFVELDLTVQKSRPDASLGFDPLFVLRLLDDGLARVSGSKAIQDRAGTFLRAWEAFLRPGEAFLWSSVTGVREDLIDFRVWAARRDVPGITIGNWWESAARSGPRYASGLTIWAGPQRGEAYDAEILRVEPARFSEVAASACNAHFLSGARLVAIARAAGIPDASELPPEALRAKLFEATVHLAFVSDRVAIAMARAAYPRWAAEICDGEVARCILGAGKVPDGVPELDRPRTAAVEVFEEYQRTWPAKAIEVAARHGKRFTDGYLARFFLLGSSLLRPYGLRHGESYVRLSLAARPVAPWEGGSSSGDRFILRLLADAPGAQVREAFGDRLLLPEVEVRPRVIPLVEGWHEKGRAYRAEVFADARLAAQLSVGVPYWSTAWGSPSPREAVEEALATAWRVRPRVDARTGITIWA